MKKKTRILIMRIFAILVVVVMILSAFVVIFR